MTYVILDIEWNGAFTKKKAAAIKGGYFNEIIEIGAVRLDGSLAVTDEFQAAIRPVVSRKLTPLVKELTGIADDDLADGRTFPGVMSRLRRWIGDPEAVIMTWSTSDLLVLLENCRYFLHEETIPFMNRYADLQAYCQQRLETGTAQQLGLGKACELLSITPESQHRALDDSRLSAAVFARLYEPTAFEAAVKPTDREFYDRLTFKTVIVGDIKHSALRRSYFRFECPECGRKLSRLKDWRFHSRAFCAPLGCLHCDEVYNARVQVKLKYDGPVVDRRLKKKAPPEAAEESREGDEHGPQAPADPAQ